MVVVVVVVVVVAILNYHEATHMTRSVSASNLRLRGNEKVS